MLLNLSAHLWRKVIPAAGSIRIAEPASSAVGPVHGAIVLSCRRTAQAAGQTSVAPAENPGSGPVGSAHAATAGHDPDGIKDVGTARLGASSEQVLANDSSGVDFLECGHRVLGFKDVAGGTTCSGT
jgi:hypothetical protein